MSAEPILEDKKESSTTNKQKEEKKSSVSRFLEANAVTGALLALWRWRDGNNYLKTALAFALFMIPLNSETVRTFVGLDILDSQVGLVIIFIVICIILAVAEEGVNSLKSIRYALFGRRTEEIQQKREENEIRTEGQRAIIRKFEETPTDVLYRPEEHDKKHPLFGLMERIVGPVEEFVTSIAEAIVAEEPEGVKSSELAFDIDTPADKKDK